jgi:hypothetical protein
MKSKAFKKPGHLVCDSLEVVEKGSFLDFLRGGLSMRLAVAVDFTASNKDPRAADSLHFINQTAPNYYQLALFAVTEILLGYTRGHPIPAFGFGASLRRVNGVPGVNHCFPLSLNFEQPAAPGVDELNSMYANALVQLQFDGPTFFAPILRKAIEITKACPDPRAYSVLLIMTDGEIHDMQQTIDLIYDMAALPISIVIVGIGSANFQKMVRLDGDDGLYNSKGQLCPRDIVQFVPFRDMANNKTRLRE